ncbi:MAG: hypothetical protein C0404_07625 [Verrucomicrobia bacterium]|nr:hypothetical protein [Verrucomicrobiota bacterium]
MICSSYGRLTSPGRRIRQASASDRAGESMIEACLAFALVCLLFLGMVQVSQVFAAREVLSHAAARGARAKTVGFNQWMVYKCVRTAAIPNSGRLVEPTFPINDPGLQAKVASMKPGPLWESLLATTPRSFQYDVERVRIPEYLASVNDPTSTYILDYSDWDSVTYGQQATGLPPGISPDDMNPEIHIVVRQDYPLKMPMHRTFYASDELPLVGEAYIENHYPIYLDDMYW